MTHKGDFDGEEKKVLRNDEGFLAEQTTASSTEPQEPHMPTLSNMENFDGERVRDFSAEIENFNSHRRQRQERDLIRKVVNRLVDDHSYSVAPVSDGADRPRFLSSGNRGTSELLLVHLDSDSNHFVDSAVRDTLHEKKKKLKKQKKQKQKRMVTKIPTVIYATGMFPTSGETSSSMPYCGLTQALDFAISEIHKSDALDGGKRGLALVKSMGSDAQTMAALFPSLRLSVSSSLTTNSSHESATLRPFVLQEFQRLKSSLKTLVRKIGEIHPMVLHLQEVQNADEDSIELLRSLASDLGSMHVLLIYSMAPTVRKVAQWLSTSPSSSSSPFLPGALIEASRFNRESMNELCGSLFCKEESETDVLVGILLEHTQGLNLAEYLTLLQEKRYLRCEMGGTGWTWETEEIRKLAASRENTMDVVLSHRFQTAPFEKWIPSLELLACLGETFHADIASEILPIAAPPICDVTTSPFHAFFDEIPLGTIRKLCGKWFRFESQLVYQYLLKRTHVPSPQFSETSRASEWMNQIGTVLLSFSQEKMKETRKTKVALQHAFFVAVHKLNHTDGSTSELDCFRLNLDASRMALAQRAFLCASYFISAAQECKLMRRTEQTLSLCYMAMAVEFCRDPPTDDIQHPSARRSGQSATQMIPSPIATSEKVKFYLLMIERESIHRNPRGALELCLEMLHDLGEIIPKKSVKGQLDPATTKLLKNVSTHEEFLRLPRLENEDKKSAMKLLSWVVALSYELDRKDLVATAAIRIIKASFKIGVTSDICLGLAAYSSSLASNGSICEAYRIGTLAVDLLKAMEPVDLGARVLTVVTQHSLHFQESLKDLVKPLSWSVQAGMKSGDLNWAFYGAFQMVQVSFCCGRQLFEIEEEIRLFCKQMSEFGKPSIKMLTLPYLESVLGLSGCSNDDSLLTGKFMENNTYVKKLLAERNSYFLTTLAFVRIQLVVYHQAWGFAEEVLNSLDILTSFAESQSWMLYHARMFCGIINVELARRGNARKYKARAKQDIQRLKRRVSSGVEHCSPMVMLLEAEVMSLNSGKKGLKQLYDTAVEAFQKAELVHLLALANERAGLNFQKYDDYLTNQYMESAVEGYFDWGAIALVEKLESQYTALSSKPKVVMSQSSRSGRESRGSGRSRTSKSKGSSKSSSRKAKLSRISARITSDE